MRDPEPALLCQNCLTKDVVCRGMIEYDSRTCCVVCEHDPRHDSQG